MRTLLYSLVLVAVAGLALMLAPSEALACGWTCAGGCVGSQGAGGSTCTMNPGCTLGGYVCCDEGCEDDEEGEGCEWYPCITFNQAAPAWFEDVAGLSMKYAAVDPGASVVMVNPGASEFVCPKLLELASAFRVGGFKLPDEGASELARPGKAPRLALARG